MNLCAFEGRYVLVQFKQPYALMLPFAQGDKPMPAIVSKAGSAPNEPPEQMPLQVPFVMGRVKCYTSDHDHEVTVIQFMDQNNVKMEVTVADDMIFAASVVSHDTIITP